LIVAIVVWLVVLSAVFVHNPVAGVRDVPRVFAFFRMHEEEREPVTQFQGGRALDHFAARHPAQAQRQLVGEPLPDVAPEDFPNSSTSSSLTPDSRCAISNNW
jgi:hypothetical protein